MSIDRIQGPNAVGGLGSTNASEAVEATQKTDATTASPAANSIQQLALEIQQGLPLETAMLRFAEQATRRRYGHLPEALLAKTCAEVSQTLAADPGFQERFARLVAATNNK